MPLAGEGHLRLSGHEPFKVIRVGIAMSDSLSRAVARVNRSQESGVAAKHLTGTMGE